MSEWKPVAWTRTNIAKTPVIYVVARDGDGDAVDLHMRDARWRWDTFDKAEAQAKADELNGLPRRGRGWPKGKPRKVSV